MPTIRCRNIATRNRCIALYPGAFRPPHAAHLTAVRDLAERPEVDEVIVIISNRCRGIPGTTQALDPGVARDIWSVYLEGNPKVRVEIAPHTSVKHALTYFDRAKKGDTLLFCIGAEDFKSGDERFKDIGAFEKQTGVSAHLIPAPTGEMTIRATALRATLARGEAGREAFCAALPTTLSEAQRARVWRVCREGMREISEIIQEKVRTVLMNHNLGDIEKITSARDGKLDPVYRVRFKDGRRYFVKYAGDTVTPGTLGERFSLKPKRRLSTERRALNRLKEKGVNEVDLPEVVLFDKATLTLVLTEVCPGGKSLQENLKAGIFDPAVAGKAARFLARCHTLPAPIKPVWGEHETDLRHWKEMLALRTVNMAKNGLPKTIQGQLERLCDESHQAAQKKDPHRLLILDCVPKNILLSEGAIGFIDFELSSSIGDPAYDLGLLLGHYILWGLITTPGTSGQKSLKEALHAYRQHVG
ncbi:MAG: phosphotransferase, partial [Nitrospiria bacterium]